MKVSKMRFFAVIILLCCSVTARAEGAQHSCMPFAGERMLFSVGWEFINGGMAEMRIEHATGGYRIITRSRSNRVLDMFHKVRDVIISEGACRNGSMQSTLFDVNQHEGRYHSRKQVRFLWRKGLVTHTQNGKTDSYDVPAGHLNAIDAFFAVRKKKMVPGMMNRVPLFD